MGEGTFAATNHRLIFELQVYERNQRAARRAWWELLSKGETSLNLTSIHHGPNKSFQDFEAYLLQVSGKIISNIEVNKLMVQQLEFEDAISGVKRL